MTQITTAQRFIIARITDLALDVSLQGRHHAGIRFSGRHMAYVLDTAPAGAKWLGDRQVRIRADLARLEASAALREMLTHLEALLEEGASVATRQEAASCPPPNQAS